MKIDPYKSKERWLEWKKEIESGIPGISKEDSDLIKRYFNDMENGFNVSSIRRGSRSFIRLNTLRTRMVYLAKQFESLYQLNCLTELKEEQVSTFFANMRNGTITKKGGGTFASVKDYVQDFKAFWHWWMKINKKKDIEIKDTTMDLDTSVRKPDWVYLTEEEVKKLCDNAKHDYKVFIMFLFDTGIRAPTELMNVKISDLYNECKELHIREEASKTFGRKIKLMLCSELLKPYIKNKGLKQDDYLFDINPSNVNRYLKRLATRTFGDKTSPAGEKYSNLSMYDFRHCSCCYWLPRYKSESALKYRFGWKSSDKIHYYSELLGMKDTIAEEDMLMDVTKTEIEKKLLKSENDKQILQDRVNQMEVQMKKIMEFMNIVGGKVNLIKELE